MTAWFRLGGHDLIARFGPLIDAAELNPIEQAETPIDDPSPTGRSAREELRRTCADLTTLANDSARYFRIPDPDADQTWSQVMPQIGRAGIDCQRALDQADPALLDTAIGSVADAAHRSTSMLNGLSQRLQDSN